MTPGAVDGDSCVESYERGTQGKSHAYGHGDGDEAAVISGRNDCRGGCRVRHDESRIESHQVRSTE